MPISRLQPFVLSHTLSLYHTIGGRIRYQFRLERWENVTKSEYTVIVAPPKQTRGLLDETLMHKTGT